MKNPLPFLAVQGVSLPLFLLCLLFGFKYGLAILVLLLPAPLALVALFRSPWNPLLKAVLIVVESVLSAAALIYALILLAFAFSGPVVYR